MTVNTSIMLLIITIKPIDFIILVKVVIINVTVVKKEN